MLLKISTTNTYECSINPNENQNQWKWFQKKKSRVYEFRKKNNIFVHVVMFYALAYHASASRPAKL